MSLEKALEANTAAVLALTEVFNKRSTSVNTIQGVVFTPVDPSLIANVKPLADAVAKKQEGKASSPSEATRAPAATTLASTAAEPVAATNTSLTYDDIKKPFLELAKRDLEAAKAVLIELDLKTLKDAKPEQYAEILKKLNANSEEGMA